LASFRKEQLLRDNGQWASLKLGYNGLSQTTTSGVALTTPY